MAIHLPPTDVISKVLNTGVADCPAVKARKWRGERLSREVCRPQMNIIGRECGYDGGDQLAGSAVEERAGLVEHEAVLVGDSISNKDIRELSHDCFCGSIHEAQGIVVIGFCKFIFRAEPCRSFC